MFMNKKSVQQTVSLSADLKRVLLLLLKDPYQTVGGGW